MTIANKKKKAGETALRKRADTYFASFGLQKGKILQLKTKNFFAISPPMFAPVDLAVAHITETDSNRKKWRNSKATQAQAKNPKTVSAYLKKDDIVMYLEPAITFYGEEAYISITAIYKENIFALYIISIEDLEEFSDIFHRSWNVLF